MKKLMVACAAVMALAVTGCRSERGEQQGTGGAGSYTGDDANQQQPGMQSPDETLRPQEQQEQEQEPATGGSEQMGQEPQQQEPMQQDPAMGGSEQMGQQPEQQDPAQQQQPVEQEQQQPGQGY